jgi:sugar O-acyltransferase (sialic acid O-acetyltransferase NeuD family)
MHKPKKFVLWGSSGHAKVLADLIFLRGGRIAALFDNKEVESAIAGVPIYLSETGFYNWLMSQSAPLLANGLAAIGGSRGRDRTYIHNLFKKYGISTPVVSHPTSVISLSSQIGEGTQILALANIAPGVLIGEDCIINHGASVDHECTLGRGVHVGPGATLCGCVSLDDNAFVGARAVILPRIRVGQDAIIGAGSVVTKNVDAGEIVAGNPAKKLPAKQNRE